MSARRYIAVVQDERGYPGPNAPLDRAPPEGPKQPMVHSVVLADEYEALRRALEWIASYGTNEGDFLEDREEAMRNIAKNTLEAH